MQRSDFARLVASGVLKDVEEIVLTAYISIHPGASRPEAYRWLRYEHPDPVAQLAQGVRRLQEEHASFDAEAVDKAWAKASETGLLN